MDQGVHGRSKTPASPTTSRQRWPSVDTSAWTRLAKPLPGIVSRMRSNRLGSPRSTV